MIFRSGSLIFAGLFLILRCKDRDFFRNDKGEMCQNVLNLCKSMKN